LISAHGEEIPAPIYSYDTTVQERILGQTTVLPQMTVPVGQTFEQAIQQVIYLIFFPPPNLSCRQLPQAVREFQPQGKNMVRWNFSFVVFN